MPRASLATCTTRRHALRRPCPNAQLPGASRSGAVATTSSLFCPAPIRRSKSSYVANSPIRHRPRELLTKANIFESLEKLRTYVPDLETKFKSENHMEEMEKRKQYSNQRTRTPRSPITPVNNYVERSKIPRYTIAVR
ncbi:hypothetical protein BS78_02G126900 [Paspalum vaginatum]|nr:hypothetical protein BS78_02G126900 [Paspalum vaginatum]